MARRAEQVGVDKAGLPAIDMFALAVLAGGFIAMGAVFSTVVTADPPTWRTGITRLLAGLAFSLGLVLVIIAGAELFTGNALIAMGMGQPAHQPGRAGAQLGNRLRGQHGGGVGCRRAGGSCSAVHLRRRHRRCPGAPDRVGQDRPRLRTGHRSGHTLQCPGLHRRMALLSARSTADRVLAIVPPIAAFVAAGFEHGVANMYFIPVGLSIKRDEFVDAHGPTGARCLALTWSPFCRKPPPGHDRQCDRRDGAGGRGLLVRLPASAGFPIGIVGPPLVRPRQDTTSPRSPAPTTRRSSDDGSAGGPTA